MPTVPLAVKVLFMFGEALLIVINNVFVSVPKTFVAEIETFVVPLKVGVPDMTPVVVLMDKPVGKFVALKLVGSLVAVIV